MDSLNENTELLWPILVYGAIVLSLVFAMLGLSFVLGQRHHERATNEPYEGGIMSEGSARLRFSAQFYLIAMLFVIFDVETIFIVSWAIAFQELGWYGYIGVSIFVILLFVVLIYEWRNGALDFGPDGKKILDTYFNEPQKIIKYKQVESGIAMEAVNTWFYQRYEHQCIYDADYLTHTLAKAGFGQTKIAAYNESMFGCRDIVLDDQKYSWESLYVEAAK